MDALEVADWLRQQIDEDEKKVAAMRREVQRVGSAPIFFGHPKGWLDGVDIFVSPNRWQQECELKRKLIDEIMSWRHYYLDEDCWYSCGLAVAPDESEPGSGCCRDDNVGTCTCGLAERQMRILRPMAEMCYMDREGVYVIDEMRTT